MRGSPMRGMFFGIANRNDPVRLTPGHPVERTQILDTGNAGADGYSVLSRADPNYAGRPPAVAGTEGPTFRGPDQSFEQ